MDPAESPKFVPGPGVGHELGVMFGFMAIMVLSMVMYLVFWKGVFDVVPRRTLPFSLHSCQLSHASH